MAREQQKDSQLQDILASFCPISLVLQPFSVGQPPITLHCDVSMYHICPFVPEIFRWEIFNNLHALSHPGVRASLKMVAERYMWPAMRQDVALWAHTCLQYQRSKVAWHTRSEIRKFKLSSSRFEHVHIDLVGPLPASEGFRLCLTCVDWFSKWQEAFPMVEISAEDVAKAFYTGTERQHTTPYHPATNGQIEISSAVESGYNGAWKRSVDHRISYRTNGIPWHLKRGSASHNCGDDLWSSYQASGRISMCIKTKRRSCYFGVETRGGAKIWPHAAMSFCI
ncbi:transposon Ty3-I Gag-Pol polyprotein [Trichonephila inaurata madagascariensis]|uniref:Transposon Ty3-I Gag-Pol polyprotein n=1 Tax=Trichonephila inaurata madagascariensis TaxID=2747483 RepID=A0A8X6WXA1_9ARAC|nr:transposon Ty3-I Gag-Pol polyprotein [Trichonephila inaurata madagascariensis]